MKRIYLSALTFLVSVGCMAQATDSDFSRISLSVVLPENNTIPAEANQLLETKLKQIVTRYGIADNDLNERFVITAKSSVVQKNITPTNPPRISQRLEVTFIIGDVVENKIYETTSLTLTGIGTNETKAYISAFQNIRPDNKIFADLVNNAKAKIMQYYIANCNTYLQKARILETKQQFDEAIYTLMQVPNVSVECYNNAQNLATELVIKKINFEAEILLKQAQAKWAGANTLENAIVTLEILGKINPMATCQPQVETLIKTINDKLRADEKQEWDFKMQQYNDTKAREQRNFEFMVKQHDGDHKLSRQRIEANRQVAIEFARNQPKEINTTKIVTLW
jgi:hypothetical protein